MFSSGGEGSSGRQIHAMPWVSSTEIRTCRYAAGSPAGSCRMTSSKNQCDAITARTPRGMSQCSPERFGSQQTKCHVDRGTYYPVVVAVDLPGMDGKPQPDVVPVVVVRLIMLDQCSGQLSGNTDRQKVLGHVGRHQDQCPITAVFGDSNDAWVCRSGRTRCATHCTSRSARGHVDADESGAGPRTAPHRRKGPPGAPRPTTRSSSLVFP